jgi:DNA polymerase
MPEQSRPNEEELARQVKQRLESLSAAGVEWLSARAAPAQEAPKEADGAAVQASLFGEPAVEEKSSELTMDQRRVALDVLAQEVAACTRCAGLAATRTQTVFGVGPVGPDLCFVGEAPGENEDLQGEPFVGAAGQLLNRIIAACGMTRQEVYICNVIRCRPPGNRLPNAEEAGNCRSFLEKQLELVAPKFICCLGACAAQNLLGTTTGIGRLRGRFHNFKGIPVLCTYHPAFLLRSPERKKDVWEDMKLLLARMGRPTPGK